MSERLSELKGMILEDGEHAGEILVAHGAVNKNLNISVRIDSVVNSEA